MIEILGIKLSYDVLAFLVLFLSSEIIALSPLRENGVVQVVLRTLSVLKPTRREDEVVATVKGQLEEVIEEIRKLSK